MNCPTCGYRMSETDLDCPRCVKMEQNKSQSKLPPILPPVIRTVKPKSACPSCGSDEWKLASLVYREGTQSVNTHSTGAGVGIGRGGIGVGVGRGSTTGTIQSEISKDATPPSGYSITKFFVAILIISAIFGICNPWWFMLTVLSIVIIAAVYNKEADEYATAMERWNKTKMCLRCGVFYLD